VALDPTRKIQFASLAGADANAPKDPNAPVRDTSKNPSAKDRLSKQSPKGQPPAAGRMTNERMPAPTRSR
jgi:hypothetical protein